MPECKTDILEGGGFFAFPVVFLDSWFYYLLLHQYAHIWKPWEAFHQGPNGHEG